MRRQQVIETLAAHGEELRSLGLLSLSPFGSTARDDARPDSDVDILVVVIRPMGLFGLMAIQERVEDLLQRKVDLVTRTGIHPALRERILAEAVDVV